MRKINNRYYSQGVEGMWYILILSISESIEAENVVCWRIIEDGRSWGKHYDVII